MTNRTAFYVEIVLSLWLLFLGMHHISSGSPYAGAAAMWGSGLATAFALAMFFGPRPQ